MTVVVLDENEKPRIEPHHYRRFIVENSVIGSPAVASPLGLDHAVDDDQFCVTDEDGGAEGEVDVTINDPSNIFVLNQTNRSFCYILTLAREELNYESDQLRAQGGYYGINILAKDRGTPPCRRA